jgi:predicted dehydrogenase
MAIEAAAAGKHVALEKPITRTVAEGRAIISAMQEHQRVFRMDSEMRSHKHFHKMAEIVRSGRLGEITAVWVGVPAGDDVECPPAPPKPVPEELDYEMWLGPAPRAPYTPLRVHPPKSLGRPDWMRVLDYSDGMITNWGTHFWDIALWCMDAEDTGPVEVAGTGIWPEKGRLWNVLRRFEVTYRMKNGVPLFYENTRNPKFSGVDENFTAYVKIQGSKGSILGTFGPHVLRSEPASIVEQAPDSPKVEFPLRSDKEDVMEAIRTGGVTMENEHVAHRVTSLCHLGHISIHLGEALRWDPEGQQFIGNDQANKYLDQPIRSIPG